MTLRKLPMAMVVSRLIAGPLVLWTALTRHGVWLLVGILVYVFLSDVFDGVIARRLQSVTEALRVSDSWADTSFYICVATAV